jgi:argininosuccinate lyase
LPFDRRLAFCDLKGSTAHAEMLVAQGIISEDEGAAIVGGLNEIACEIESGTFPEDLAFEDIHMNIEKRLIEIIGPVGGKLHTGRSRNDQVALDMHLYLREELVIIDRLLKELQRTIIKLAREYEDLIIPGYTHLQRAQPVLLAHHLLAYFWMFGRDRERIKGVAKGTDLMPLGAGALAGTGFPIDRELVAEKLGFGLLYENSIDAVSDRDYLIDFLAFASILIMHLSRFSEELILWSSSEFGFIELDDAYTTGSSMMPQKKNPDVAELVRGKTGRFYGILLAMLTMMKGLPLAYNKDMQEDKEGLFAVIDQLKVILPIFAGMLQTITINRERLLDAVDDDYLCATDIADYLVSKGLAFRDAHHLVGEMIAYTTINNKRLRELNREERISFHPSLAESIDEIFDPVRVVKARSSRGGTAPAAVKVQIEKAIESLKF